MRILKKFCVAVLLAVLFLAGCGKQAGGALEESSVETVSNETETIKTESTATNSEESVPSGKEEASETKTQAASEESTDKVDSTEQSEGNTSESSEEVDDSTEQSEENTSEGSGELPDTTEKSEEKVPEGNAEASDSAQKEDTVSESAEQSEITAEDVEAAYVDSVEVETVSPQEVIAVLTNPEPAIPTVLATVASGERRAQNGEAAIDYSHMEEGYVMVQYSAATDSRLKVLVKGPSTTYTYDLPVGAWTVFPLSDGNGDYTVGVYRNVTGTKYAAVLSEAFSVSLHDEFAPFLRPNQYVNFTADSAVVKKGSEVVAGVEEPLDKVAKVYDFVVGTLSYDTNKAATVTSGYLPVLDEVLKAKTGICFDYAAMMTAMLRSQNVPCKLIVGYAGQTYHAWINVWTEKGGWVDGAIFFDGSVWKRMDPTFASSGSKSQDIMDYIGRDANYVAQFQY